MTSRPTPRASVFSLVLVAAVALVYLQVGNHEFLLYDDPNYVTDNPHIRSGLTLANILWAFSSFHDNNWFPLTWISHMLDVQLFGLEAGWHHLGNVALHSANSILLLLLLNRLTGCIWRSAIVAALFALHPLHVESVAWVAERKDVFSTLFLFLTLHAYLRYTERPGVGRYILTVLLFTLGLMAKPMLVSLPLIMLLIDYWPLHRLSTQNALLPLLKEKFPFAALALVSCVVTVAAQKEGISSLKSVPFLHRLGNAAVSYTAYIGKTVLPLDLSVFYPLQLKPSPWQPVTATLVLAAISLAVWHWRKRSPYLLVGWLWYLIMLVPVIGLIQIGMQAMADRYTYVSLTGLFILAVWLGSDIASRSRTTMRLAAGASVIVIVIYAGMAWRQVSYWKSNNSLFTRALQLNRENFIASHVLGILSAQKGDQVEALTKFEDAISSAPWFAPSYLSAGNTLMDLDRTNEALAYYETALSIFPTAAAHYNLGSALHRLGEIEEAVKHYRLALRLAPANVDYLNNLGIALAEQEDIEAAVQLFREALRLDPAYENASKNLDKALNYLKKQ